MNEWKTDRRTDGWMDGRTYEHIKWIIVERGLYCAIRVVTKYSLLYKGLWRIGKSNHDDDDLLEISLYYVLFGYIHGGRCCNIYYRIIQIKLNSFTQTKQFFFDFAVVFSETQPVHLSKRRPAHPVFFRHYQALLASSRASIPTGCRLVETGG